MSFRTRLLLATVGLVVVTVVALTVAADRWLRDSLQTTLAREMEIETRLVAAALPHDRRVLPEAAHRFGVLSGRRVTLIDSTGRVLGDSDFDDASLSLLDNHLSRPEIQQALADGAGTSLRHSASTNRDELKVAVRAWPGFVRLSAPITDIQATIAAVQRDVLLAALVAVLLGSLLAIGVGRTLARPLRQMATAARQVAQGAHPTYPASSVPEIRQLVRALRSMQDDVELRMTALRRRQQESETLIASMAQGVIAADARGTIHLCNPAARQLLGHEPEDVLPPLRELFRQREAREAVERVYGGEFLDGWETDLDGRAVLVTGRPLPDGGAVLGLLDVSDLKRLQAVRRDFVANVSHELKTPLTSILGYAETLLGENADEATRAQFLRTIRDNAERMRRLVDDLLDLAKLESGGWTPVREPLDLITVAAEAWQTVQAKADRQGVTLVTDLDSTQPCEADVSAVREMLVNLFDNAIRHSPRGAAVHFASRATEDGTELTVRDSGSGIPAEHIPRVFERFYRVDPGRSRAEGGTGLGLAIVRHLVEGHGGTVELESTVGQGTTVRIVLPQIS